MTSKIPRLPLLKAPLSGEPIEAWANSTFSAGDRSMDAATARSVQSHQRARPHFRSHKSLHDSRAEIYVPQVPGGIGNRASFPGVGVDVIQHRRQSPSIHIGTKIDAGARAQKGEVLLGSLTRVQTGVGRVKSHVWPPAFALGVITEHLDVVWSRIVCFQEVVFYLIWNLPLTSELD